MKTLRRLAVAAAVSLTALAAAFVAPAAACAAPLKVAVVVSSKTDAWYAANDETERLSRTMGQEYVFSVLAAPDVVAREGWQVSMVGDSVFDSLATLQQYDCIVLTQVFCLDVQPSKNLQTYVGSGGGLVCMWGSPRVAPQFDTGPTETWPEHWANILHSEAGEWGPMSEVYQVHFINDQFWDANGAYFPGGWFTTPVWPGATHPVLDGAKTLLQEQGYASGDFTLNDPQDPYYGRKEGFELVKFLSGNTNTTPLLSFKFTNSEALNSYPRTGVVGGYPAAVAARYKSGRSCYFYFYLNDFIYYDALGGKTKNASGITNRVAGTALLESAVRWAGTQDGVYAPIHPGGVTWGDLKVYGDAIYGFQYVGNEGNVTTFGEAEFRVYDPSGKLVMKKRQHDTYVSVAPKAVLRYSNTYKPGGALKAGRYRVEVEYRFNYPWFSQSHKQVAYVTAGQGTGIKTLPVAPAVASPTAPVLSATLITPNGDGWTDKGYVDWSQDQPALVSVRLLDTTGKVVGTILSDLPTGPGAHYTAVTGTGTDGKAIPNGMYQVAVDTRNTAGTKRRAGGTIYISRFAAAPALSTSPTVSAVRTGPVYGTRLRLIPRVKLSFSVSQPCYAVIKVLTSTGAEARTLALNRKLSAGTHTFTWDGTDAAGRKLPAGSYRYWVFVGSGGTAPKTSFQVGTVRLSRPDARLSRWR